MDKTLTIGDAGSILLGAGLVKVSENPQLGLILVGAGALLKILVAVLQKEGLVVSVPPIGG